MAKETTEADVIKQLEASLKEQTSKAENLEKDKTVLASKLKELDTQHQELSVTFDKQSEALKNLQEANGELTESSANLLDINKELMEKLEKAESQTASGQVPVIKIGGKSFHFLTDFTDAASGTVVTIDVLKADKALAERLVKNECGFLKLVETAE